ncbi:MAG: hypothetical protein WDO18_03305 [Acidobacteriota bacterium]
MDSIVADEVSRCVNQVLAERGIELEGDETFADLVARMLKIPNKQSQVFLESLYNGATVEQACTAVGIDSAIIQNDALIEAAQAIGIALGRSKVTT